MRMLIVDDDRMICAGTARRITSMQYPEVEAVECAYSAEEAIELMHRRRFDAMFTDIRMGMMDGLALIHAAKEINPSLICIVITAFDHFQYVQQALRLDVDDYLVKPLSMQSMQKHVRAVIDKYTGMTAQRESRLELEICTQILSGERDADACFALCGMPKPPGDVCIVVWNELPAGARWEELDDQWTYRLANHRMLLTAWHGPETCRRIQRAAARMGVFAGVSAPGQNLKLLSGQAGDALRYGWTLSSPGAILWTPQNTRGLSGVRQKLLSELRAQNAEGFRLQLGKFLENLPPDRLQAATSLIENILTELSDHHSALDMETPLSDPLRPGTGTAQAVRILANGIDRLSRPADTLHPVAYAKRYASEHLYENIDMAVIANHLNLSYAYFSRIFREHAGVTFSKYLLDLRMEEICRLLLKGEKLVDIADKFGYQNAANLSRSFTREMGMSPSKWLEKHIGGQYEE